MVSPSILEERANLGGVPISVILCVVGAGIGFLVTRLNDWIVESREFRRASRHLRTEAANIIRHYTIAQEKLAGHETEVAWRNVVNLEIGRFYGSGLGTFDMSALRLFDEQVAEEAMYLMLTIRNNNAYIEQAKLHLASGDKEQFHDVCQELTERCQLTIERAQRTGRYASQRLLSTSIADQGDGIGRRTQPAMQRRRKASRTRCLQWPVSERVVTSQSAE